jgi:hypothetical protein
MKSTLTTPSITRFAFDNISPLRNGTKSSIRRRRFKPFATGYLVVSLESNRRQDEEEKEEEKKNRN